MAKRKTIDKAKARTAKAKLAASSKQKAKHTAVLTTLKPIAKEINVRLEKADTTAKVSLDHRVAAALRLAEAVKLCKKAGITFKKWAEENVDRSYHTVLLLSRAGAESDPTAAVQLIRSKNAEYNRVSRDKKKAISRENAPANYGAIAITPFAHAINAISALEDQAALSLAADIAATKGMYVISGHDHIELADLRKAHKTEAKLSLDRVKHDFDGLSAADKMALVFYAAKKVGCEIIKPNFDQVADRPDFLDRSHAVPGLSPKKKITRVKDVAKVIKRGAVA